MLVQSAERAPGVTGVLTALRRGGVFRFAFEGPSATLSVAVGVGHILTDAPRPTAVLRPVGVYAVVRSTHRLPGGTLWPPPPVFGVGHICTATDRGRCLFTPLAVQSAAILNQTFGVKPFCSAFGVGQVGKDKKSLALMGRANFCRAKYTCLNAVAHLA